MFKPKQHTQITLYKQVCLKAHGRNAEMNVIPPLVCLINPLFDVKQLRLEETALDIVDAFKVSTGISRCLYQKETSDPRYPDILGFALLLHRWTISVPYKVNTQDVV